MTGKSNSGRTGLDTNNGFIDDGKIMDGGMITTDSFVAEGSAKRSSTNTFNRGVMSSTRSGKTVDV